MAWVARVTSITNKGSDIEYIYANVSYFSDQDTTFQDILYVKEFRFDPTQTKSDMLNAIIAEGQRARAVQAQATKLQTQVPVNTVIAVP